MTALLEPFTEPFMLLAVVEVLALSLLAGLLGAQIVLRGLAFFTHGVGSAAFPGLVVAGPLGVPPALAGLAGGLAFAVSVDRASGPGRLPRDAATALALVGALALGSLLASDLGTGGDVELLLFGTLLGLDRADVLGSLVAVLCTLAAWATLRRTWAAAAFDRAGALALGLPVRAADLCLLLVIALAAVASLSAVGALLVSAVLVLPGATAGLVAASTRGLQLGAGALAAGEGLAGLWLAYRLDVPPGPVIAVLAGACFGLTAVAARSRGQGAAP